MRHKTARLLLTLALATCALAQGTKTVSEAPSEQSLRAHVGRLASDDFGGRRTGTEGARKAAAYVESEFRRLGLRPGATSQIEFNSGKSVGKLDSYLQPFPYVAAVELGRHNAMSFLPRAGDAMQRAPGAQAVDLRVGEDWSPVAWGANGRVERAAVVFVGHGITASELGHDDYAGVDMRGRIALALAGTPDGDNPHGRFARFNDPRFKAAAARDHGASALLIVTREENFKDDRLARLRMDESIAAAGDAGLPVALVSQQVARRAVEASALPLVTFERLEQAASGKLASAVSAEAKVGSSGAKPAGGESAGKSVERSASPQGGNGPVASAGKNSSTPLPNVAFSLETDVVRREAPAFNVVGLLEGSDPVLRNEAIVIGAHYDHLGLGGEGSLAPREGEIHHGADDNASGVAGLLEVARIFSTAQQKPRRTLVFVAFGGEEEGLIGSSYYAKSPAVPLAQVVAMINLDMIGRLKEGRLIVGGVGTAAEWRELLGDVNTDLNLRVNVRGVPAAERRPGDIPIVTATNGSVIATADPKERFNLTMNEDGYGPSDHSSFYSRQVPVLFFWTGTHEDYHKPTDTADRLNYEGLARVTAFVRDVVRAIDEKDKRPTYTAAKGGESEGRSAAFRVYLGTIPSYAEGGEGLKLDGVRQGSPAEKAGLKAGDVVVRLAGRDVKNVYDYTYSLGEMKADEEYEVEVLRAGARLKLRITPAARK